MQKLNREIDFELRLGTSFVRQVPLQLIKGGVQPGQLNELAEKFVFDRRLDAGFDELLSRVANLLPVQTAMLRPQAAIPTSMYVYEIEAQVPLDLLSDISDLVVLPAHQAQCVQPKTEGTDKTPTNSTLVGRVDRVPLRIYLYPDPDHPQQLALRRVAVDPWNVLNVQWVQPRSPAHGLAPCDWQINFHAQKILKPDHARALTSKIRHMLSGIREVNDVALVFQHTEPELRIEKVERKEKVVWSFDRDMDLQTSESYVWYYTQDPMNPGATLHPDSSVPEIYSELAILPVGVRAGLVENAHLPVGEVAGWTMDTLLPNSVDMVRRWLVLGHRIAEVMEM
jgi:hypothetical protein